MTEPATKHLAPELAAIEATMRVIEEASATLVEQHAQLAQAIVGLAVSGSLTKEERLSLIRDLYWRHPEVKVKHIAPLVGNKRAVPEVAGPYELRCGGCDAPVPVRTRSDLAHQRRWNPPQCEDCWLKAVEAEEAASGVGVHPSAWSLPEGGDPPGSVHVAVVSLEVRDAKLLFAMATAGRASSDEAMRAENTIETARDGRADAPADLVEWAVEEARVLLDANELGVVGRVRASGLFERCTPTTLRAWLDRIEHHLWQSAPASGW